MSVALIVFGIIFIIIGLRKQKRAESLKKLVDELKQERVK